MGEWIEWGGGEQPVGDDVTVETKWSDGSVSCGEASEWRWDHRSLLSNLNLIAYRVSGVVHWIEWTGATCCPVAEGKPTEVKFRNGRTDMDDKPEFWDWNHTGVGGDIVAYRIIPEQPTIQNGER
ncbi:hypothetical protein AAM22_gp87 [Pantoea phage vB_PagM_AAM22]|nr:hypothetical protein AAM22_gp87 [Pantoea phage vB_PagM_AAM22]